MCVKKNGLLFLSVALIGGCALYGPKYVKPEVKGPDSWNSRDYLAQTESTNLPELAWWNKFNDPELSSLIESGLANNNNIQVAVGNIQAAQGQLKQIQYSWIPNLTGFAGNSTSATDFIPTGYSTGLVPNYSLNVFQLLRSTEYAKANLAMVQAAKNAVKLTVISQVSGGYITLRGQDNLLTLQTQLVTDLAELLKLTKLQYDKGLISLYTLQQYEQQYEQAKAQIPIIQNNIVLAQNALKLLLNENPGIVKRGIAFNDFKSEGIIPVNLPSDVLKNRPDVIGAEQGLIAANANIGVATANFFPSISLTGGLGSASTGLSSLFSGGTDFWARQIQATIPILSFSTYGQIEAAKGAYYAAYNNYIQTVRAAFQSVDNDLSSHDKYTKTLYTQIKFADSTNVAYDLAGISYEKGLYSYPTLLTNKVKLDNALITVTLAKISQLNTIVQLYQDLAGGYLVNESSAK